MRIGIDARRIGDTGIGRHLRGILRHLPTLSDAHEYVLFMAPEDIGKYDVTHDRVTIVAESAKKYGIAEHWRLASAAKRAKIDLFHEPHYTLPLGLTIPSVVTIYDIIHLQEPSLGLIKKLYAWGLIGAATRKAKKIITISKASRNALMETVKTAPEKIVITLCGGGEDFCRPATPKIDNTLHKFNLTKGFILFVGSDRPHKNLEAVRQVAQQLSPERVILVVGRVRDRSGFDFPDGAQVRFVEGIDNDELAALYSAAGVMFFPSLIEGFGLPPLEAMSCGTPVVASNRSAMPEVIGDAGLLVDPTDAAAMTTALLNVLDDPRTRTTLINKGYDRAARFTWKKTAEQTVKVYEDVMNSHRGKSS